MQIQIIKALIRRPKFAFLQIKKYKMSAWLPFILIMVSLQIFWVCYFANIDLNWLLNENLKQLTAQAGPNERQAITEQLTPELMRYSSHITSSIMLIMQGLLIAAYLNIATKLDENNTDSYKDWFAFYWWIQLPMVAQLALSCLVLILTDSSQARLYELQITSLNQLVGLNPGDAFYSFLATFDLFSIWSFILMFYGLSIKTQLKTSTLANICMIPIIVMFSFSYIFK